MQYDLFIKDVRERANVTSADEAKRAIEATFTTLAERLAGNEASQLSSQLPTEFHGFLTDTHAEPGADFGVEEFFDRVAHKEGVDHNAAVIHAQAVMWVLSEAITRGELTDIRRQLSPKYAELLQYTGRGLPNNAREARNQPF